MLIADNFELNCFDSIVEFRLCPKICTRFNPRKGCSKKRIQSKMFQKSMPFVMLYIVPMI